MSAVAELVRLVDSALVSVREHFDNGLGEDDNQGTHTGNCGAGRSVITRGMQLDEAVAQVRKRRFDGADSLHVIHKTSPSVVARELDSRDADTATVGECTDTKWTIPSASPSVPGSAETPNTTSALPTTNQAVQP